MGGTVTSPLSEQDLADLKDIATRLPTGHPSQGKINLLLNSQPTQFEKDRSGGGGVSGALKTMLPEDPTEGRSVLDPKFWFNTDKSQFNPKGSGTAYNDLTRELPKDLDTNVLSGDKPGQDSALGRGIYRGASLFAPLAGVSTENMESASGKGDTAGVATQAAVPAAMAIGAPLIKANLPRMRTWLANALRDPATGKVTVTPTSIAERVVPQRPEIELGNKLSEAETARQQEITDRAKMNDIEAQQHKEFAGQVSEAEKARQRELADAERLKEQHAESLQRRGGEQQALDTAHEKQLSDIEKARQKELADQERLKLQHGQSLMRRGVEQSALDAEAAKQQESLGPKIVTPQAGVGEPRMGGNEGRPATWTNEDIQRLAAQGNREAIQQIVRRGMRLPPNARYVMGDPDFGRTVYNPRESTTFTPEGQPIRNVENPTERAPRERIAIPTNGAEPKETINAATGEVTIGKKMNGEMPRGNATPFEGPERRTGSPYEREIFQKMITNPEGEQLGKDIRSARGEAPSGITEGDARNYLMKQPGGWEKFTAADEAGRRKMLIDARNALQSVKGNGRMKGIAFGGDKNDIKIEGVDTPHSQESDRVKIDPFAKKYQRNLRKEPVKRA